jgi:adenine-specific DNA-methyltransferase
MDDLFSLKIMWIELSDESKFCISDKFIPLNTVFFMTGENLYPILGILNSKIILWYFSSCLGTTSGVGTNRWLKYKIEDLPICQNYPMILANIIKQIIEKKSKNLDTSYDELEVDRIVSNCFNLSDKEFEYINNFLKT